MLTFVATPLLAYNNGMARKPPLGWQTWCSAGPCGTDHCFDFQIKATAKAMKENGMYDNGFNWVSNFRLARKVYPQCRSGTHFVRRVPTDCPR